MKKLLMSMLMVIVLFGITSCSSDNEKKETDAIQFKEEYELLNGQKKESGEGKYTSIVIPKDNAIVYSSAEEILTLLEKGTGVIYFGYPECPWCRAAISTLLNTANTVGIDKIYYLNAKEMRDQKHLDKNGKVVTDKEGSSSYYQLLKAMNTVLPAYDGLNDETIKRLYFPSVVFVKDGTILGFHEGTVDSQEDPSVLLSKTQEQELSKIYSTYMHEILGDSCDKNC